MFNKIWQFTNKRKEEPNVRATPGQSKYVKEKKLTLNPERAFDSSLLGPKQKAEDMDKHLWQPDAIYAQFFSQEGCEIKVTANFTEEEAIRANRKQMGGTDGKVKLVRGVLSNEVTEKIEKSLEKKDKKAEIRFWNNYIAEKKLEKR